MIWVCNIKQIDFLAYVFNLLYNILAMPVFKNSIRNFVLFKNLSIFRVFNTFFEKLVGKHRKYFRDQSRVNHRYNAKVENNSETVSSRTFLFRPFWTQNLICKRPNERPNVVASEPVIVACEPPDGRGRAATVLNYFAGVFDCKQWLFTLHDQSRQYLP